MSSSCDFAVVVCAVEMGDGEDFAIETADSPVRFVLYAFVFYWSIVRSLLVNEGYPHHVSNMMRRVFYAARIRKPVSHTLWQVSGVRSRPTIFSSKSGGEFP